MTTSIAVQKVVVFRTPEDQGNFRYWLAELSREDARRWEERLTKLAGNLTPEIDMTFGNSLTLPQVMEKLKERDFQVFDLPGH